MTIFQTEFGRTFESVEMFGALDKLTWSIFIAYGIISKALMREIASCHEPDAFILTCKTRKIEFLTTGSKLMPVNSAFIPMSRARLSRNSIKPGTSTSPINRLSIALTSPSVPRKTLRMEDKYESRSVADFISSDMRMISDRYE